MTNKVLNNVRWNKGLNGIVKYIIWMWTKIKVFACEEYILVQVLDGRNGTWKHNGQRCLR